MTTAQSRFYQLLLASPGGVIAADVLALLDDEDEPGTLKDFIASCRGLFLLSSEVDEERSTWFHLKALIDHTEHLERRPTDMNLYLPRDLHRRAKSRAVSEGITLRELTVRAIERELA